MISTDSTRHYERGYADALERIRDKLIGDLGELRLQKIRSKSVTMVEACELAQGIIETLKADIEERMQC